MREKKELMYDCISWFNRNYKKSGHSTFEKVSGFWPGILNYNFRKSGKEMGSPKRHETGKGCNS